MCRMLFVIYSILFAGVPLMISPSRSSNFPAVFLQSDCCPGGASGPTAAAVAAG